MAPRGAARGRGARGSGSTRAPYWRCAQRDGRGSAGSCAVFGAAGCPVYCCAHLPAPLRLRVCTTRHMVPPPLLPSNPRTNPPGPHTSPLAPCRTRWARVPWPQRPQPSSQCCSQAGDARRRGLSGLEHCRLRVCGAVLLPAAPSRAALPSPGLVCCVSCHQTRPKCEAPCKPAAPVTVRRVFGSHLCDTLCDTRKAAPSMGGRRCSRAMPVRPAAASGPMLQAPCSLAHETQACLVLCCARPPRACNHLIALRHPTTPPSPRCAR